MEDKGEEQEEIRRRKRRRREVEENEEERGTVVHQLLFCSAVDHQAQRLRSRQAFEIFFKAFKMI